MTYKVNMGDSVVDDFRSALSNAQKLDSVIHEINHYLDNKYYTNQLLHYLDSG